MLVGTTKDKVIVSVKKSEDKFVSSGSVHSSGKILTTGTEVSKELTKGLDVYFGQNYEAVPSLPGSTDELIVMLESNILAYYREA